jgi:hypothetical protein
MIKYLNQYASSSKYRLINRKLLTTDLSEICPVTAISFDTLMNHIFSRSTEIQMPATLYDQTELEYTRFTIKLTLQDLKVFYKNVLDSYLEQIEQQGKVETCLEHPVLRKVLMEYTLIE